jgi:tetratricopeptide (TPR) repeat protein
MTTEATERLQQKIHDLSWKGHYWGKDGVLPKARLLYRISHGSIGYQALSALSSSYFSAAGNAIAHAKQSRKLQKIIWFMRGILTLLWAAHLSNKLERRCKDLTARQLDVRGSILLTIGRNRKALKCYMRALQHPLLPYNERMLLIIGIAKCYMGMKNHVEAQKEFVNASKLLVHMNEPRVLVRYYKAYGNFYLKQRQPATALNLFNQGLMIARKHNLQDQIDKIQGMMKW